MSAPHKALPTHQALGLLRAYLNERPPLVSWARICQIAQDAGFVGWEYIAGSLCQNSPDAAMFAWFADDAVWLRDVLSHDPNDLDPGDLAALLSSRLGTSSNALAPKLEPYASNLREWLQHNAPTQPDCVDLSNSMLGDEGIAWVTDHIDLCTTQTLRLAHCGITSDGLEYLTTFQPTLPRLQHLDVSGLPLSVSCAEHVIQTLEAPRLRCMHLHRSFATPEAIDRLRTRWTVLHTRPSECAKTMHTGPYSVSFLSTAECTPRFHSLQNDMGNPNALIPPRLSASLRAAMTQLHTPDEALYNVGSLFPYTDLERWRSPSVVRTPYIHLNGFRRFRTYTSLSTHAHFETGRVFVDLVRPDGVAYHTFIQSLGGEITSDWSYSPKLQTAAALHQGGRLVGIFLWAVSQFENVWIPMLSRSYTRTIAHAQGYTEGDMNRGSFVWELGRISMHLSAIVARCIFGEDDVYTQVTSHVAHILETTRDPEDLHQQCPYVVWDPPRLRGG